MTQLIGNKMKLAFMLFIFSSLFACGGGNSSSESAETTVENDDLPQLAARPIITNRGKAAFVPDSQAPLTCRLNNIVLGDRTFAELQAPTTISITYDITINIVDEPNFPHDLTAKAFFTLLAAEGVISGESQGVAVAVQNGRNVFTRSYVVLSSVDLGNIGITITTGPVFWCQMEAAVDISVI